MDQLSILMVNDSGLIEAALQSLLSEGSVAGVLSRANGIDEALESIVAKTPDLCFVCEGTAKGDVDPLLADLAEAGIKIPVLVFMVENDENRRQDLLAAGAIAAIHSDSPRKALIEFAVRNAFTRKTSESQLRKSNERLVRELLDNQDARERAEQLTAEYAEMAEELNMAKVELEKLNQEKNKFFSIIAHDLKSPFNAILGFSRLLTQLYDDMPPEEIKECAEQIHGAGERAFEFLENLLEWGRLQMNRIHPQPEDIWLAKITDQTIKVLGSVAKSKSIQLENKITDEAAYADPHMTDTIIRNLVNNAIKFTPPGGAITITATANGPIIEIAITDTGVGMSAERAETMFSLSNKNTSTVGTGGERGTGLGLLLCKEMAEKMGGVIRVESEEGKGSIFAFTLPMAKAEPAPSPAADVPQKTATGWA